MEVSLDVLDGLTIGGVSTAGLSALESNPWLSIILLFVTVALQLLKRGLASIIGKSVATNPINLAEHTTVTIPAPISPTSPGTESDPEPAKS